MSFFKKLFGGITSSRPNKNKENDDFVRIYIEENSYKSLRKEKEKNCGQICDQFMHVFPRKNKKSEFRIVLILRNSKKPDKIISKRILNNFERIFDGPFLSSSKRFTKQYLMVDVQEYLLRQHYLPTQVKAQDKPVMNMRIEREGLLEMQNVEKREWKKKHFILTPEVLIYHEPGQKGTQFSA